MADVLHNMGFPLDALARDVVSELHRLSEGDPLLVRLYVDDLWARGEAAARLRPEDLQAIAPGLKGYFDRWWEDQRRLWGEKAPLKEPSAQAVLNLLACALGPLSREDVLALAGEVGLTTWTLEEALRPLARFVVGDGRSQGYVFQHPRLGFYFHDRLSRPERRDWEGRFVAYGRRTLAALGEGTLPPEELSPYLSQYLSTHLRRAGERETLFALADDPAWYQAQARADPSGGAYLNDVAQAWAAAEEGDAEVGQDAILPYLGREIRCALATASLHSLSANIPPELLVALVENGLWTPAQALGAVRQNPEAEKRAEALAGLAPHLPEPLLREALTVARKLPEIKVLRSPRAEALTGLAPYLPEPLLREALDAARALPEIGLFGSPRAEALAGLASHLWDPLRREALREGLAVVLKIESEWQRAKALARLIPHLPEELLREVLVAVRQIRYRRFQTTRFYV